MLFPDFIPSYETIMKQKSRDKNISAFLLICSWCFQPYFFTGAPLLFRFFSGTAAAGAASTFPLTFNTTVDCVAFDCTVMLLFIVPTFLVLYLTTITPDSPGNTGSLGHVGIVQPQLAFTLERIRGSLPVLVKVNSQLPSEP